MIRTIEKILRKHLDDDNGQGADDDMMTRLTPYEYIWPRRTYGERLALAREIVTAMTGRNLAKLVKVPSKPEAEKFVRSIMPVPERLLDGKWQQIDNEFIQYHARALRQWLANYRKDRY